MANIEDFDNMNEQQTVEPEVVTVKLATLGNVDTLEVEAGTTVEEFKEDNDLEGRKLVSRTRGVLSDTDVIMEDEVIFVSTSKENG